MNDKATEAPRNGGVAKDVRHLAAKEDRDSLCPYRLIKPLRSHFTGKTIRAIGRLEHTEVPHRVREDGTVEGPMSIRLWNAADGKPLKTLRGHTASVVFVRFSPDGRRLASANLDGTVKVWTP